MRDFGVHGEVADRADENPHHCHFRRAGAGRRGYAVHARAGHDSPSDRPAVAAVATAAVVRTDLADYWTESGTVGYRKQRTLRGIEAGVLTWLPRPGSTISRGGTLYRVGDRPVALFYGSSPMFRDIDSVGTVGRDVKVLADNLRALGYRIGDQPAPGTRVTVQAGRSENTAGKAAPGAVRASSGTPSDPISPPDPTTPSGPTVVTGQDAVFTRSLKDAVKRWQDATGIRRPPAPWHSATSWCCPARCGWAWPRRSSATMPPAT